MDSAALVEHYREEARSFIEGRQWVVATDVLVGSARMGLELLELGAKRVLAIGASRGTGELPEAERLECLALNCSTDLGMMEAIRASDRLLMNLPPSAREVVDRFDPDGQARVIGTIFGNGRPIADRSVFGARPPSWQALEDKMIVDAIWDKAGIERAPSAILPTEFQALWSAHGRLDAGMGTVWVGDNREGWHGGAKLLRWVRDRSDAEAALDFLGARCDRLRVMPFLDGIPCSIHGWVFPDSAIGFRPCEMLVFRIPGSDRLSYAGAATSWEPSPAVTQSMREGVIRLGRFLRQSVGYRGSFTMDGVATVDGFRPTELNPRFGAALSRMSRGIPELPLYLLHLATAEGLDLDYRSSELQELVCTQAAAHPVIRGMHLVEGMRDREPISLDLCALGEGWRKAEESELAQASLNLGPAAAGTLVLVDVAPAAIQRGPSAAGLVYSLLRFADEQWDLGMGPLEPAPDLRMNT